MSDLTPQQISRFKRIEDLMDFKRLIQTEKEEAVAQFNWRIDQMKPKAAQLYIDLSDLEAKVSTIEDSYDAVYAEAERKFREQCSSPIS